MAKYFTEMKRDPTKGTLEISGERYVLVRAASMSVDFFDTIRKLYHDQGEEEAHNITKQFLFDIAHSIGMQDARNFHLKQGLKDPVEKPATLEFVHYNMMAPDRLLFYARLPIIFLALLLGLALNTKYTAALLVPALAAHALAEHFWGREERAAPKRAAASIGVALAVAAIVLLSFYGIPSFSHYLGGLKATAVHVEGGQMSFLNGKYSIHGFWYYFLYAIMVKTPLPVLGFAALAVAARIRERPRPWLPVLYLMFFPALLLVTASTSNFHIGLRHVLPVYPFLFVFCGGALRSC